jgi:pimeloyl-ACP methyl ester carboxylesterase
MSAVVRVGAAPAPDGALLAFRVEGEGGRALAACNGLGTGSAWRALSAHFAARGDTFVTWDYRGQGQSPAAAHPESMTISSCAGDLRAVLDAVPVERAVLLGSGAGAHVIVEAYRQNPERVLALVPVRGGAAEALARGPLSAALEPLLSALVELGAANAELAGRALRVALAVPGAVQAMRALGMTGPNAAGDRGSDLQRLARLDLRGWFALARDLLSRDAKNPFAEVRLPVLQGQATLLEQPELFALKLEKFLEEVEPP